MSDTVVELREGRPRLSDIPGRLRWLADEIEAGRKVTDSVLVLVATGRTPEGYNFGECQTFSQRIASLEMCKLDLMTGAR